MKRVIGAGFFVMLTACATTSDPGWHGSGAVPFDTAKSRCEAEAARHPAGAARNAALEDCMARHGWRRR